MSVFRLPSNSRKYSPNISPEFSFSTIKNSKWSRCTKKITMSRFSCLERMIVKISLRIELMKFSLRNLPFRCWKNRLWDTCKKKSTLRRLVADQISNPFESLLKISTRIIRKLITPFVNWSEERATKSNKESRSDLNSDQGSKIPFKLHARTRSRALTNN